VDDAAYFMKFALGSYGWPLYMFMNPCSGPWNLCGGIRYYEDNSVGYTFFFLQLSSRSRFSSKCQLKCNFCVSQYRVMVKDQ